jgi:type I restriction enzyme S subunit
MSNENKLIPELRFPEFENEGEWDIEALGVLSEIVRGGSPRPIEDYFTSDVNGLNWLKIADVPSDSKYITQTKVKVKKEALSSTREVSSGDLILSNSMSFGRPYILKITTCIHDGWIAIRKISNKTFEDYLYYFISSESSQSYFQTNAAGAAVKNLNAEIIKLLPIYIPKNKKEQQKIASCFSSLDEVIAAHSQKLELLKDHKKGIMQNLFPQEGEKVPKYRFKEFENDGEWVEKIFDDILDITRLAGYEYSEYWKEDENKEIIALRGYNIGKGTLLLHNLGYISNELSLQLIRSKLYKGDIVYPCVGTIGNAVVIEENNKYHIQQNIAKLTPKKDVSPYFISQFLMGNLGMREVNKFNATSSQPNVLVGSLRNFKIFIPKIAEQQKIASCLSSLDALITAQAEKIEQLKLHKSIRPSKYIFYNFWKLLGSNSESLLMG